MTDQSGVGTVRSALPPDRAVPVDAYAIDGALPATAVRPRSREEVATLLAAASRAGLVVVPQGSRTALRLGRPLTRYDIALDLGALDRVVAYEPDDLTVTVEAGLTLERLQALLGEHGQYLPVDAIPDGRVTIGGLLATARPGAWRGHLPGARDLVLGITVALPDGSLAKSGGRVVKNVSGYDLHRLHTGALGAYGAIVEASFKITPLPAATRSVAVRCAHLPQAEVVAFELRDRSLATRALTLLGPAAAATAGLPGEPHVLVEFGGVEAAVDRSLKALHDVAALTHAPHAEEMGAEAWAALNTLAAGDDGRDDIVLRLGVPPSELRAAIEAAEESGYTAWGHLASGSVVAHAQASAAAAGIEAVRSLRAQATAAGGFLQVEASPASLRLALDPFGFGERELVRALKQQFDPAGTINRGRWLEGV